VAQLTENNRAEAVKTEERFKTLSDEIDNKVTALAGESRAASEAVTKILGQQIKGHVAELTENGRADAAKTEERFKTLGDEIDSKITALAGESRAASDTVTKVLGEKIDRQVADLTESGRAAARSRSAS
jgi:predicted nucleic acid-binding protein